jgi:hypothetical protein
VTPFRRTLGASPKNRMRNKDCPVTADERLNEEQRHPASREAAICQKKF